MVHVERGQSTKDTTQALSRGTGRWGVARPHVNMEEGFNHATPIHHRKEHQWKVPGQRVGGQPFSPLELHVYVFLRLGEVHSSTQGFGIGHFRPKGLPRGGRGPGSPSPWILHSKLFTFHMTYLYYLLLASDTVFLRQSNSVHRINTSIKSQRHLRHSSPMLGLKPRAPSH